jgi:predicted Rossmann fold flavoprotein
MKYDVVIIGSGAAGLMCAIEAGKRGRKTIVLDHSKKPAEKIRISGGGRCNFTNLYSRPENYLSTNNRFCVSALKRFTQQDFIKMVEKHNTSYHEKTLGQLFCDDSAQNIIDMLLKECNAANVEIKLSTNVGSITNHDGVYHINTSNGNMESESLVIAAGGLSIPKMGATSFGYDIARQFDIKVTPTRAALVPFTFAGELLERSKGLSGISVDAIVICGSKQFKESILFTHRGISGPAILQISSYWSEGQHITINMLPSMDMMQELKSLRDKSPKQELKTILSRYLPKRLAYDIAGNYNSKLTELSNKILQNIADDINKWQFIPCGTEGYRTAEVTLGGVDTNELSSKTFESKKVAGLYFIGEVVDVTGHLGGFNFQWAWSSGHASGQFV